MAISVCKLVMHTLDLRLACLGFEAVYPQRSVRHTNAHAVTAACLWGSKFTHAVPAAHTLCLLRTCGGQSLGQSPGLA